MPLIIGDTIPNFFAQTTKGNINFYDYQGNSWIVLFSHPADFTPVCTTELGRIAVHKAEFEKRNVKLLAHSVDDLAKHVDWVNDIKSYCRDIPGDFPYPIIADEKSELAREFDMIDNTHSNSKGVQLTARALYIIDPKHIVRLYMSYPASTGRNVDEILRTIDSLQLVDRIPQIATPANWMPGDKVMILPTVSDDEANELFGGKVEKVMMPSGVNYVRTTTNYKIYTLTFDGMKEKIISKSEKTRTNDEILRNMNKDNLENYIGQLKNEAEKIRQEKMVLEKRKEKLFQMRETLRLHLDEINRRRNLLGDKPKLNKEVTDDENKY